MYPVATEWNGYWSYACSCEVVDGGIVLNVGFRVSAPHFTPVVDNRLLVHIGKWTRQGAVIIESLYW
jgi:hypothetical protein